MVDHVLAAATTLGWLCYESGRDPELQRRVREQVLEVVGDRDVTYADIAELTLLDQVVSETLRLHTPNWLLMRRTVEEVDLGDCVLPPDVRLRETKLMGTLQPRGLRMITEELP